MKHQNRAELVELGLAPAEAQVYLALVENASLSASSIAETTGLSRSSIYQMLCALADKGLVESGTGYGSKFAVVAPNRALPALIARERDTLSQREEVAAALGERLLALTSETEVPPEELIQVIRNPRAVMERFERLQLEAEKQIDCFVKPPYFNRTGNQVEQKVLRHGVRIRGVYEKTGLEDSGVKPYFHKWITAGEDARIYDGELPHKMVIFDSQVVLMPLIMPGEQMRALLIRNAQLARNLTFAFQYVWDRSEPVAALSKTSAMKEGATERAGDRISRNGRRGQPAKK